MDYIKKHFKIIKMTVFALVIALLSVFVSLYHNNRICLNDFSYTSDMDYLLHAYRDVYPKSNSLIPTIFITPLFKLQTGRKPRVVRSLSPGYKVLENTKSEQREVVIILGKNDYGYTWYSYFEKGKNVSVKLPAEKYNHYIYSSCGKLIYNYKT